MGARIVAKDQAGDVGKDQQPPEQPKPTTAGGSRRRRSAASEPSTRGSSASSKTDPLDLDPGRFKPPEGEPPRPRTAADLEADHDYEPAPPELIDWTPERAAAVVRALGFGLHMLDPVGHADGGDELWRWTKEDALEAGEPLARIMNRYAPMRRLAGFSDEAELAIVMTGYIRQNMAHRGRVVAAHRDAAELAAGGPVVWGPEQPPPPEPVFVPAEPIVQPGMAPWAAAEPPPDEGT
jgi:hypothetical protein